jgi:hypothetical protein
MNQQQSINQLQKALASPDSKAIGMRFEEPFFAMSRHLDGFGSAEFNRSDFRLLS